MSISILDYSVFCLSQPRNFIGCGVFWFILIACYELLLIAIFVMVLRKFLRKRREWQEYYQRLADREKIADPEIMDKYIWRGE